jgi:hypothetical protein
MVPFLVRGIVSMRSGLLGFGLRPAHYPQKRCFAFTKPSDGGGWRAGHYLDRGVTATGFSRCWVQAGMETWSTMKPALIAWRFRTATIFCLFTKRICRCGRPRYLNSNR